MIQIYTVKENGDLKLIAEGDDEDAANAAIAVDLLLDEESRIKDREFRVISPDGVEDVVVNSDDPVNPRRDMTVTPVISSNGAHAEAEDEEEEEEAPKPKRGPGRPKGSTNKKKSGRGPGRPKGSKNKTTGAKRGPGRPKGSKNKTTKATGAKRGPGRPKGSKNKKRKVKTGAFKSNSSDDE